jgi:hypothetical protein
MRQYRLALVWLMRGVAVGMWLLTLPTIAQLIRDEGSVEPLGNNIFGALSLLTTPLILLAAAEILALLMKTGRQ